MFRDFMQGRLPDGVEAVWNGLLAKSSADTVFLTWEWISCWWRVYGAKYHLALTFVYDEGGALVAAAPFKVRQLRRLPGHGKVKVLEFIGWGERVTPEYLDVIVVQDREQEVLPQLIDHCLAVSGAERLDLRPISADARNLKILRAHLASKAGMVVVGRQSECPVVTLPDTWEKYLAQKSKNFRKKMKEFERVCRRDLDFDFHLCRESGDTQGSFEDFIHLHRVRWGGQSAAFRSSAYLDFHRQVAKCFAERGWLRLFMIYDGKKAIGAIYCYFYGGRYYYYQSGRDVDYEKYRLGLVLINRAIAHAISEGAAVFDFLTGCEPYKFRWADAVRTNVGLRYYARRMDYRLARLLDLKSLLRGVAARLRGLAGDRDTAD